MPREVPELTTVGAALGRALAAKRAPVLRHGAYTIDYDPPPIPIRAHDWRFVHDDYDGPGDRRCGTAASVEACIAEIDEIEADA